MDSPVFLTTADAAEVLDVSSRRVRALITAGRLRATLAGRDWLITPDALDAVRIRKPGKPALPSKLQAKNNRTRPNQ